MELNLVQRCETKVDADAFKASYIIDILAAKGAWYAQRFSQQYQYSAFYRTVPNISGCLHQLCLRPDNVAQSWEHEVSGDLMCRAAGKHGGGNGVGQLTQETRLPRGDTCCVQLTQEQEELSQKWCQIDTESTTSKGSCHSSLCFPFQ